MADEEGEIRIIESPGEGDEDLATGTEETPIERAVHLQSQMFGAILNRLPAGSSQERMKFPEFDCSRTNPKAWVRTCNLIMSDRQCSRSDLAMALANSIKGSAGEWLAEIIDENLSWDTFQEVFISKYCQIDTPAAVIHQSLTSYPKDGDTLRYTSETLIKLRGAFRGRNDNECALLLATALAARSEPDVRRWAYTHEKINEVNLMKELKAAKAVKPNKPVFQPRGQQQQIPHRPLGGQKRPFDEQQGGSDHKNLKPNIPPYTPRSMTPTTSTQQKWCNRCKKDNHNWTWCYNNPNRRSKNDQNERKQATASTSKPQEKRVNSCTINPQGTLQHQGSLPKWLNGDFLSIGPGVFDVKDFTMNHWCDGFGVVCKFSVSGDKGKITFTKRHINSDAYNKAKTVGKPVYTEFGTKAYSDPSKGFFSKIMNNVMPELTDNETNCIYKLGNTFYLATESSNKRTLNVDSLISEEKVDLGEAMKINLACSHVYFDPDGTGYTIGTSLTSGVKTQIFKINPEGSKPGSEFKKSQPLCTLPNRYKTSVSFAHSFGLGEKQIVFIEQPFFMNGMKLISLTMKGKCMWDTMEWKPEEKNRFVVVDKATGQVSPILYESDSAFFFHHHINTYESNGELVVDVMAHDSPEMMDKLWLKELRKGVHDLEDKAVPRRFILPLIKNEKELMSLPENQNLIKSSEQATAKRVGTKIVVSSKKLSEPTFDLPTVNFKFSGKPYSYFYGTGMYAEGPFQNSVVKANVETGDIIKWTGEENQFPGEPIFVQQPGKAAEDDGVVLSLVVDTDASQVFLLIISANNMQELGRATVTSHVPCLLHAMFAGRDDL